MTPQAAARRIELLTRELNAIAAQPTRSASEREEVRDRVEQLQSDIELVRSGNFAVGN